MAQKQLKTYSVRQITDLISVSLEQHLPSRFIVNGQISGFKVHVSGHCYFSLKDADAVINCVMWKSKFSSVKFAPDNGMSVLATGYIDVYPPAGRYQLYIDKLQPAGIGDLQLAFEQMVKRLKGEGLFDDSHKKQIPAYPMKIGILTSQSGAALMDIIDSIYNRWPCVRIAFNPIPVQGQGAADKIAKALRRVNARNKKLKLDVVIIGRGGGSMEDLWAFNEEPVARSIYDSKIPVISAVGHEVDITIADLVADARASTPTKAGVIAVPDMKQVIAHLNQHSHRLTVHIRNTVSISRHRLDFLASNSIFRGPQAAVKIPAQKIDDLYTRLKIATGKILNKFAARVDRALGQVSSIEPNSLISSGKLRLHEENSKIMSAIWAIITKKKLHLTALENRLSGLNPRLVLTRGYSLTSNKKTGRIITSIEDLEIGDILVTELADGGKIDSRTLNIKPGSLKPVDKADDKEKQDK